MKAVVWTGVDEIELRDVPIPELGRSSAMVKVCSTGICGSDITIVAGKHPRARTPLVLGHEFMGVIESLPDGYDNGLTVGQRVVVEPLISCKKCRPCREGHEHVCENLALLGVESDGAFSEYVAAPIERVYPIPETLSDNAAAVIEPLAVAVHAVDYAELQGGEDVVVLGAGPIGLLVAQVARARNAGRIWICEVVPGRLRLAQRLGFETIDTSAVNVVDEILSRTDGWGAQVTFDAAGASFSCETIIPITGIKGRIVMVAIHKKPCEVFFQQLSYREQTILGTRIYARGNFQEAIRLASEGLVNPETIVTHTFGLDDALQAFDVAKDANESCKVLVQQ